MCPFGQKRFEFLYSFNNSYSNVLYLETCLNLYVVYTLPYWDIPYVCHFTQLYVLVPTKLVMFNEEKIY